MSDITEHKWFDCDLSLNSKGNAIITIELDTSCGADCFHLNKSDAMAIANHFKDHIYFNVDTQQFEEIPHNG